VEKHWSLKRDSGELKTLNGLKEEIKGEGNGK
jgi:hypothetical protein